jgi:hypothetical protein
LRRAPRGSLRGNAVGPTFCNSATVGMPRVHHRVLRIVRLIQFSAPRTRIKLHERTILCIPIFILRGSFMQFLCITRHADMRDVDDRKIDLI